MAVADQFDGIKELFSLPSSEAIYESIECSSGESLAYKGRLYISENFLSFSCNMIGMSLKFSIRIQEITSIKPLAAGTLKITTFNDKVRYLGGFGKNKEKVYRMVSSLYQGDFDPDEDNPVDTAAGPSSSQNLPGGESGEQPTPSPAKQISFRDQNPLLYLNLKNEYFRDSCIELMQVMTPVQLHRFNEMCFEDSSPYNHRMFYEIYGHKAVRFDDWVEDHADKRRKLQFLIPDSNSQFKSEIKVYATQRYLHSKQSFTLLTKYNLKSDKFSDLDVETLLEGKSIQSGRFCSMLTCKLFIYRDDLKKIPSKVIETLTEYFKHESHCWAKEIIEYRLVNSDRVQDKFRKDSLMVEAPETKPARSLSQVQPEDGSAGEGAKEDPSYKAERFTVDRSARRTAAVAFQDKLAALPIIGPILLQTLQGNKWVDLIHSTGQTLLDVKQVGTQATLSKIASSWSVRFGSNTASALTQTKPKQKSQLELLYSELESTSRIMIHVQYLMTVITIGVFLRALELI